MMPMAPNIGGALGPEISGHAPPTGAVVQFDRLGTGSPWHWVVRRSPRPCDQMLPSADGANSTLVIGK